MGLTTNEDVEEIVEQEYQGFMETIFGPFKRYLENTAKKAYKSGTQDGEQKMRSKYGDDVEEVERGLDEFTEEEAPEYEDLYQVTDEDIETVKEQFKRLKKLRKSTKKLKKKL